MAAGFIRRSTASVLGWSSPTTLSATARYFFTEAETLRIPAISISMKPLRPVQDMRAEIAALIAEAVPETDDMRRHALLVMADHWRELIDRRRPSPA